MGIVCLGTTAPRHVHTLARSRALPAWAPPHPGTCTLWHGRGHCLPGHVRLPPSMAATRLTELAHPGLLSPRHTTPTPSANTHPTRAPITPAHNAHALSQHPPNQGSYHPSTQRPHPQLSCLLCYPSTIPTGAPIYLFQLLPNCRNIAFPNNI